MLTIYDPRSGAYCDGITRRSLLHPREVPFLWPRASPMSNFVCVAICIALHL